MLFDGQGPARRSRRRSARAAGVFLAFQYPVEIPGVGNIYFLKAVAERDPHRTAGEETLDAMEFLALVREKMKLVEMPEDLMGRSVNEGFSGGEKKRNEMLQMAAPRAALRGPRRDRLGPRHRRAAHRGRTA